MLMIAYSLKHSCMQPLSWLVTLGLVVFFLIKYMSSFLGRKN